MSGHAPTIPPAEDSTVERAGRLLASGVRPGLPGFPVAVEPCCLPVTVAGPRRNYTGFRYPRSLRTSIVKVKLHGVIAARQDDSLPNVLDTRKILCYNRLRVSEQQEGFSLDRREELRQALQE